MDAASTSCSFPSTLNTNNFPTQQELPTVTSPAHHFPHPPLGALGRARTKVHLNFPSFLLASKRRRGSRQYRGTPYFPVRYAPPDLSQVDASFGARNANVSPRPSHTIEKVVSVTRQGPAKSLMTLCDLQIRRIQLQSLPVGGRGPLPALAAQRFASGEPSISCGSKEGFVTPSPTEISLSDPVLRWGLFVSHAHTHLAGPPPHGPSRHSGNQNAKVFGTTTHGSRLSYAWAG